MDTLRFWTSAIINPSQTLEEQKAKASLSVALVWLVFTSFLCCLFVSYSYLFFYWNGHGGYDFLRLDKIDYAPAHVYSNLVGAFLVTLLVVSVFFLLNGVLYFVAHFMGGKGRFAQQVYSSAAFWCPAAILSAVIFPFFINLLTYLTRGLPEIAQFFISGNHIHIWFYTLIWLLTAILYLGLFARGVIFAYELNKIIH
ncbi:MAG: hypothetical protein WC408_01490 [Candidatus Micrarchaeia archaeon]